MRRVLKRHDRQLFHTFIEIFFFHIDLKMFTETVPSIRIAMESKAMSIECKHKTIKMMQISM